MRKLYQLLFLFIALLGVQQAGAQIATNITGGSSAAGSYSTFAAAITALNGSTISGPVVVEITAGQTETLAGKITMTATGTAANTISIQKTGAGANPKLISYVGTVATPSTVADGFFVLAGSDYVTIDGLDLEESAANTTTTTVMEFGYGLFKASVTDGCQNNTIKNCTITLNRLQNTAWTAPGHNGSCGIAVLNGLNTASGALTITAASGSNSFNKFYSNTIQNCNAGIVFIGFAAATPFTFASGQFGDSGNDVGGSSASTGNTVLNYGGGAILSPATGIFGNNQWDFNISYNTINNNNGSGVNHATTLRGIFINSSATGASATVNNNNITVKCGGTTSQLTGIESAFGASSTGITNTISLNNNTVTCEYLTATTGVTYGVYHNTNAPTTLNMNGNNVTITSAGSGAINGVWSSVAAVNCNQNSNTVSVNGALTSATVNAVYLSGAVTGTVNMNNNNLGPFNFTTTASTSLGFRGTYISTGNAAAVLNMNNNSLSGLNYAGANTGFMSMFGSSGTVSSETINNNSANNITIPCTGAFRFLDVSNSSATISISGNSLTNFTNNVASTSAFQLMYNFGSPTGTTNIFNNTFTNIVMNRSTAGFISSTGVAGIFWGTSASATHNFYNNTFDGFTNNGAGTLSPLSIGYGANASVYNNTIKNISSAGIALGINYGNSSSVNVNVYSNTISSITSTGASTSAYGILMGTAAGTGATGTVNVYKNNICGVSSTGASGTAEGIRLWKGAVSNVYNNLIGGITAANSTSGTAVVGINLGSTTAADVYRLYFNTVYLTGTGATNFGSAVVLANTAPTSDIRNNIFSNMTTPTGTGLAVGHRRTSTTLTSFASTSNNNMWYAGVPSATNLIYYDGTNSDQTMSAYQTRVATRENVSFSTDVTSNFLSTTCGTANFLHIDPSIPTQLESSALGFTTPIAVTTDYDGDTRNPTPDLGADEFAGTSPAPAIVLGSISPALTAQCSATARDIYCDVTTTAGSITTVTINYAYNGVAQSPITMTNIGGDTYYGTIPAATPSSAIVTWSIVGTNTLSLNTIYPGTTYNDDLLGALLVTATASANPACAGASTVLNASIGYPGGIKILGAGSTTSATYSNPFYSAWSNTHNQHLILASELSALGMVPGNISALGMNITVAGTLPMIDFSLKIGSTTATNMSSFVSTPLTTVYTNSSYLPVLGVNTMTFTTPFYWDGVSNVVLEFCHGNAASTATMSRTCQADATSFISCIHTNKSAASSAAGQCSDNTTGLATYSVRPRFYLTASVGATNFVWNDGTSNIGTSPSITVTPANTTTYSCSMDALGCTTSGTVVLNVTPVPAQPTATNSTQCGVAIPTASVSSNAGVNGTGQFFWYNAASAGTLLQGPPMGNTLATVYSNDFSSATLTNSSISGNASIASGILTLTPSAVSQSGAFTVNAAGSYNPSMLQVNFDESNGPSGNADGFSYSFCDDGSATGITPTNEEYGTGSKLRIAFDTYGAGVGAAGIYILYGPNVINSPGQTAGTNGVVAYSSNISWVNASNIPVQISVDATGLCTVIVNGTTIFSNVQLPAAYASANKSTWKHFFKARSGGIAGTFAIDNLNIQTNVPAAGTPTWLTPVGTTTTYYVSEKSVGGCETLRTPVTVTVNTPPVLTVSSSKTVCNDVAQELSVTSFISDYDTYIWSPSTNLFTDLACTTPYTGSSLSTVYFKSNTPGVYSYALNASDAIFGCANVANVTMSVLPASITTSATPANLCVSGNATLSFTPTANLYNSTLQWLSSPNGVTYSPISGANGTSYTANGLTTTTYYRITVTDNNNSTCLTNDLTYMVYNPTINTTTPGSRCGTGTVTLGATTAGAGNVNWYADPTGGSPLATGTSYTTPVITSTTTYYASANEGGSTGSTGLPNRVGATTNSGYSDVGLMFNAIQPFTLNSVAIYPVATTPSGNVTATIALKNSAGTILQSTTVSVPTSVSPGVKTVVPLNFAVPTGTGHRLVFTSATGGGITGFIRELTTGFTYPYTVPGVSSITSAYTGGASSSYYYYFYDWSITYGCEGTRVPVVATINTAPAITLSNTSICTGQTATLNVSSSNPDYTYTWMPGNLTGATQSINPSTTTVYTVTALDNTAGPYSGCQLIGNQTVTVNPNPTLASINATPSSVNPGCNTSVSLSAVTSAPFVGTIGDNASTLVTSTTGITPYTSFYEGARVEYIIQASELSALGFTAGNISSLGFDVTTVPTVTTLNPQVGYTIKIANTGDAAFSGAYATPSSAFQTVYGPVTQGQPSLGINTYTFASPYYWDGVSNLVIDICHENDNNATCSLCYMTSSTVRATTTSFNSVYGRYNDDAAACGVNATLAISTFTTRPNIILNGIAGQITDKVWQPGALTGNTVTVTPSVTSTYSVTCTNASTGCTTTGNVTVTVNPSATLSGLNATYIVTDAPVTLSGTPTGGVFSGPGVSGSSFDPATAGVGTHTISYMPAGYCVPATFTVVVNPAQALVPVKIFLQGYYLTGGSMQPVLLNQGMTNPSTDCDDVTVELHDATTPYATAFSYAGILQTDGTINCTFPAGAVGNSYYIVVIQRNHVQSWSANPVAILSSTPMYNFTTAQTQAYGDNQIEVETGVWAIYTGDVNQDLAVDGFDYIDMDPNIIAGDCGYFATDVNGDGCVDAFDFLIASPNIDLGITIQAP